MTTPIIRMKIFPKPVIKGKMDVRFPANIETRNFLTVARANGKYTFDIDYTVLTPGPIADPTTAYVAILDQTTGIYRTVTLASLLTSGLDADLQAIAALTGTGILARTAANTWAVRTITAGASIGITNGDGVAGNPTIAVTDPELVALAGLTSAADALPYFTGSGAASLTTLTTFARTLLDDTTQAAMRTTLGLTPGTDVQAFDSDLAALAANAGTGLWSVTGAGTGSVRTLTAPAAGITVTNGGGVAGNPTLALANDLAALEGLASTGIARRTGTDTWSVGSAVALSELATQAAFTFVGNNTSGAAVPTAVDIAALTAKASPAATDLVMISDQAASGAFKKVTVSSLASAGSVSSIAGNTGAFTLAYPLGNVVNDIRYIGPAKSGYFTFISSTSVQMQPRDGDLIKINGVVSQIPGSSISAANTSVFVNGVGASNLAASTLYYVYVFNNAGTLTIDFSTTAYAVSTTAGNVGTIIKNADDTRTLVGMVFTNGSSQFVASNTISWFNKKARQVAATAAATSGTVAQVEFCTWADEAISSHLNMTMTNGTVNAIQTTQLVLDGAATGILSTAVNAVAGNTTSGALSGTKLLAAGRHTVAQTVTANGTPTSGAQETYVMFRG